MIPFISPTWLVIEKLFSYCIFDERVEQTSLSKNPPQIAVEINVYRIPINEDQSLLFVLFEFPSRKEQTYDCVG